MTRETLKKEMTVKEVLERWPETLDVFIANGFENFRDERQRQVVGAFLKLGRAAQTKDYDLNNFLDLLQDKIDEQQNQTDVTMKTTEKATSDITIAGLLPCPVRLPLLEGFDKFIETYSRDTGYSVSYKLEAASVGADWIEEQIKTIKEPNALPEIFLSAGFETFFDRQTIGRFKDQQVFKDIADTAVNADFSDLGIKDPKMDYSIIAAVPAVFMVNHEVRADLPVPRTWTDLLRPELEQQVALPVGDFDLFNALLLAIHQEHGTAGVEQLGRSMLKSMHPSQMVKNAKRVAEEKPFVTIMPYFFTKMTSMVQSLEIIWPEDGAVLSPIFMLTRRDSLERSRPIAEYLAGREVGEVLAHKGLFPSLHPKVDNRLGGKRPWKWIGWDYINNNDIGELIQQANQVFEDSMNAA
jgi:ABC-type Fe3+ transport system substrate-binding protein